MFKTKSNSNPYASLSIFFNVILRFFLQTHVSSLCVQQYELVSDFIDVNAFNFIVYLEIVFVNLTQLVGILHNLCRGRGSNI